MMMQDQLQAQWFDGRTARRTSVLLRRTADDHIEVWPEPVGAAREGLSGELPVTPTADGSQVIQRAPDTLNTFAALVRVPRTAVVVGERIGNTPYLLQFPDGALAVSTQHGNVEAMFGTSPSRHWLARMEEARWLVVAATVGLAIVLVLAWQALVPRVAASIAESIPRASEESLGRVALQGLDRWLLKPTQLDPASEEAPVQAVFDTLARHAGLSSEVDLEFRASLPNALAIPGGTVVVTDGLVRLFAADERLLAAVLAHELGHVHYRHSLRHLIAASASAMIVGTLLGDVSGISSLTANAPILLAALDYTRDAEREADQYAFTLLRKAGYSPRDFADAMRRFDAMEQCFALRAKARANSKDKPWKEGDSTDDDQIDSDETARPGDKSTANKPLCTVDPEGYVNAHRDEQAQLSWADRETGYLHTHPVTRERIEAAETAARQ